MMRTTILAAGLVTAAVLSTACQDPQSHPTAPGANFSRDHDDHDDDDGRGFVKLISPVGPGRGGFRAIRIPHPTTPGNFAIHVEVRLHHVKRNATYVVQRAVEAFAPPGAPAGFDLATTTDGSCQRGLFIPPWSTLVPASAPFVSFPDQGTGSPTITTDARGDGTADFVFAQTFPLPLFDAMFRVLETGPVPTSALFTDCINLPLLP